MFPKVKLVLGLGFLLLFVVLVSRTIYFSRKNPPVVECKPVDDDFIPLSQARKDRFTRALQFETTSYDDGVYERSELHAFGEFIKTEFPVVHSSKLVEWERVNNYSLLYSIRGSNSSLRPYLLMSHLDVVPVTNLDKWEQPPFSGNVFNQFFYGRGAIDVKQCVMGIMEALEYMLSKNIKPARGFYVAFGHDEEVRGADGAAFLSKRLEEKGVTELEFISDEGLPLSDGIVPGVKGPVASIGVAEKGQVMVELSVELPPGHSSMPPKESTIGILARAVLRLETNSQPSQLGKGAETAMFESLAPEMGVLQRLVVANIWLFKPVLSWFLSRNPTTSALIRTATGITMFNAGVKKNVIPPLATAVINHRIHPAQSVQEVLDYDKALIADERIKFRVLDSMEPHPTAPHGDHDFGYQVFKTSVRQIWPSAIVVPGIMVGNTDTRHYLKFTSSIYRFSPTYMFPDDPARFHGLNERISVTNYGQAINFFYHLMRNADRRRLMSVHPGHGEL